MILSDVDIIAAIRDGELEIDPLDADARVQPASVDLTLGDQFAFWDGPSGVINLATGPGEELFMPIVKGPYLLRPLSFALGTTVERVRIGAGLAARLEGKSTLARNGLIVHATAGFIDPGFPGPTKPAGHITLEFFNLTHHTFVLVPGEPIAQLALERTSSPAVRPYGTAGLGSKYVGQNGVQPPKWKGKQVKQRR